MGMFYKRRDYTRIVDGRNPIVAHEFLGSDVEGKDMLIIDDMISSGEACVRLPPPEKEKGPQDLRLRHIRSVHQRTGQLDQAYKDGIIDRVLTTNLIYQTPELLARPYYINCDMSKYIALIIDTLNHDGSISSILSPDERIQHVLQKYKKKNGETI